MRRTVARGLVFGLAAFLGIAFAQTINSSLQQSQDPRGAVGVDTNNNLYVQANRHLLFSTTGGVAPTLGTCAGGTLVAGSTDQSGAVSGTTGTSCIVNFGVTYLTAPRCVSSGSISSAATTGPVSNTTTTTALTMTVAATGAGVWSYFCSSNS